MEKSGVTIAYQVGVMIELPRAALRADEIAEYAEFFSFGTNDLTQTTFGISAATIRAASSTPMCRRASSRRTPSSRWIRKGWAISSSSASSVGARPAPDIKLGVCGEHGGDPASIQFFEAAGLDYVSCSPYRVPIARLAAAQAALGNRKLS